MENTEPKAKFFLQGGEGMAYNEPILRRGIKGFSLIQSLK